MNVMFNTGPTPAGEAGLTALLAATQSPIDTVRLHALLCAMRDTGVPQAELVGQLTDLLDAHPAHDDGLREALDMVTGWCVTQWHVYPQKAGTNASHDEGAPA